VFSSLANYVRDRFTGALVFGDLHADYAAFLRAAKFAESNDLFLVSLGDLVDRGDSPYEVVSHMYRLMKTGRAGMTVGNHDDRFRRYYDHKHGKGSVGGFSADAQKTLDDVGEHRMEEFLDMYNTVQTMDGFGSIIHTFDDIALVHAAAHPTIWDHRVRFGESARARFLYGETTGRTLEDGMPERLYNWIEEIPNSKTVLVGHDRKPVLDVAITEPFVKKNSKGGTAVFIDTGCGKGGFLTGAVLTLVDRCFTINRYVKFRNEDANL
jgi:protein phosphatase